MLSASVDAALALSRNEIDLSFRRSLGYQTVSEFLKDRLKDLHSR